MPEVAKDFGGGELDVTISATLLSRKLLPGKDAAPGELPLGEPLVVSLVSFGERLKQGLFLIPAWLFRPDEVGEVDGRLLPEAPLL